MLGIVCRGANGVNTSMIADEYPVANRGFAYGLYSSANLWGIGVAAVLSGFVGQVWGWRTAFLVDAVPGALLILLVLRLRDPERGLREAEAAGESEAPPMRQLGPVRTARLLFKIPAFRWLCGGAACGFAGVGMASGALGFYFSAVFDVQPIVRGVITGGAIPFEIAALAIGGVFSQRLLRRDRANLVMTLTALLYVVLAVLYYGLARAQTVVIAVIVLVVAETAGSFAAVPMNLILSALVPANVRTQGFGVLAFCLVAVTPVTIPIGLAIGDSRGFRSSLAAAVPLFLLTAVFIYVAGRTTRADMARALAATLAEVDARRRRASGESIGILDVRGLDVSYGSVQVLFGVDFHVSPGETVALLGTNGAGKSTLLKAISGLITPSAGLVLLDGENVTGTDAEVIAGRGIVTVPGGVGVFPRLSVERNLELGAYAHWRDRGYVRTKRAEVLEMFPKLVPLLKQPAGTLSGGEQQMLTLAQGLMGQPKVLLIDELSLGLAPTIVADLLVAVRQIQALGIPIVVVEQSVNIALSLAQRAYFMEKGQIRFEGPTEELLGRTDLLRSIFLEGATTTAGATGVTR
jgi:branched-chain amino acid transport system ATP-binding protein